VSATTAASGREGCVARRRRALLTLVRALLSLPVAALAAPMLVEESAADADLPRQAWFAELPDADASTDLLAESEPERLLVTRRSALPLLHRRASTLDFGGAARELPVDAQPEDLPDGTSLRDYLRAYLNTRPASTAPPVNPEPASVRPAETLERAGDSRIALSSRMRALADQVIVQAIGTVLMPGINDAGLLTLSLLGYGEFVLVTGPGGEGLGIGAGDGLLFTLGASDTTLVQGAPVPGGGDPFASPGAEAGGPGSVAGGGAGGLSGEAEDPPGGGSGTARTSNAIKLFGLAYEILTYPGTIFVFLVLLGIRVVQFIRRRLEFGLSRRR